MVSGHHCRSTGLLLVWLAILTSTATDAIVNSKIDRIIDLSSQIVKIIDRIHVEEANVGTYKILVDPSHRDRLAYIEASVGGQVLPLVTKPDGSYEIDLADKNPKPLTVTTVFTKLLKPYPAEITQDARQFVRYSGLQTTLTPYLTRAVTTKIKLPQGSRLESFTKATKMTTGTNKLIYGPFKDIPANKAEPFSIHFENNSPFVAVTSLLRTVEVSPWAQSINIANHVRVAHVGAKLKGPFSRIDYQRDHSNGISSVKNLNVVLPKAAKDIYYRDSIGNISTSTVHTSSIKTTVNIKPRFPLFGGWGTDFNLGYRVPITEFLNEPASGNNFRLSIPFADVLFDNMFIEEAEVRVTLPAGASDVEVKAGAIDVERQKDETSYSYLDVIGRPVVILRKRNVVAQHVEGKTIVIRYNYSKVYMAQELALLAAAALGTLIMTALYSKLTANRGPASSSVNKIKTD